jgi:hypothetical protein
MASASRAETRQQDAHGLSEWNLPLEQSHPAIERHPPDPRLGQRKASLLGGDDDVAAEHHFEAAAHGMAIHAGNDRDVQCFTKRDTSETARSLLGPVLESRGAAAPLHVGAGAECAVTGACEDHQPDVTVGLDLLPYTLKFPFGGSIDRVEDLGPVDRDPSDVIAEREMDRHQATGSVARMPSSASTSSVC